MPKIVDPDDLAQTSSVIFNFSSPTARTIDLATDDISGSSLIEPTISGSNTGVTLQALYSFCKEEWKTDNNLIKIPFPLISITKNQFDFINSWDMANDRSRYLVRDAGWSVRSGSANTSVQEWVGVVTLGALAPTDQVYYLQSQSGTPENFEMTGPVNQSVLMYSASSETVERNFRNFLQLFVREWEKTYAQASVQSDLQVPIMEYVVYSLPLTNAPDLKITEEIESQVTGSPYNEVTLNYLSGSLFTEWAVGFTYPVGAVVQGTDERWYITQTGGTSAGNASDLGGGSDTAVTWESYDGERLIGATYYPFNIIIDAGAGKNNSISQIYTRIQYLLRQSFDIDDGTQLPPVRGDTAPGLLRFLGDTLITSNGVYIDNFQDADTNSIDFFDVNGLVRRFPFVATGIINFNDNLINDPTARYFMFFTSVPSGDFGTANAVIVNDALELPVTGSISGSSSVAFTFDYDFNNQGGRTIATNAPVTVVAIGLSTAQYVVATSTIERSKANNISLVSALERNYSNP